LLAAVREINQTWTLRELSREVSLSIQQLLIPRTKLQKSLTIICFVAFVVIMALFLAYQNAHWHEAETRLFYKRFFSAMDLSLMEFAGYALEIVTASIFLFIAWTKKQWHWVAYTIIFIALFLDDGSFHMHERIGWHLENYLGIDTIFGELFGFTLLAVMITGPWLYGLHLCYQNHQHFVVYVTFAFLICVLAFFGVAVDAFHSYALMILPEKNFIRFVVDTILCFIEDGMELFILGVIFLCSIGFFLQEKNRNV
jgi:hypothetical protein